MPATTMTPSLPSSLTFLTGGGEMAARIARHDWAATPLGPIEFWPAALRTTLGIALNSKFPTFLGWGAGFVALHNDAYLPMLGRKEALGRPFREVWAEIWDTIGPIAE